MLEYLFRSKIRRKAVELLFFNENKSFYLSEIAGQTGSSPGSAQRELDSLVKAGILKSEKKGNLRFYSVDKKNPLFAEFKNIILKT